MNTNGTLLEEQERLFTLRCNAILTRDSSFSNSFVYSISGQKIYCRPDCPALEVKTGDKPIFFGTHEEAESKGYKPCESCRPELKVKVSDEIVDNTVKLVNKTLGLGTMSDEQKKIKQEQDNTDLSDKNALAYLPDLADSYYNHARSNSTSNSPTMPSGAEFQSWRPRRASIANGHIPAFSAAVAEMTSQVQNEANRQRSSSNAGFSSMDFASPEPMGFTSNSSGDHARLVNRACRQLAAAAAAEVTVSAAANGDDSRRSSVSSSGAGVNGVGQPSRPIAVQQRKKRRGGLLGFRVLAARAGLSPWHFHRVFRTVTGYTPKAYGDACMTVVKRNPQIPEAVALANAPAAAQQQRRASVPNLGTGPSSIHHMSSIPPPQQQQQQQQPLPVRDFVDNHAGQMVGLGYERVPTTHNNNIQPPVVATSGPPVIPTSTMPLRATNGGPMYMGGNNNAMIKEDPMLATEMARYGSGSSATPVSVHTSGSGDIKLEPGIRSANNATPLSQGNLTPVTMDSLAANGIANPAMMPIGYDPLTDLNSTGMYSNDSGRKSSSVATGSATTSSMSSIPSNPTMGHIPMPRHIQSTSMDYTPSDLSMAMTNSEPPSGMVEDLVGTSQSAFLDDPLMDISATQQDMFATNPTTTMSQVPWLDTAPQTLDDPFVSSLTAGPVDMAASLITTSHDNELLATPRQI
ncbi:hypothetical protein TRVA0_058S00342 [Trichomonascus vanleenenianus]|uniref:uncharacterized protein n=1 Tax=Trichomonascus vanleenenianus TaxID=2268995 RepID=UPI003ECB604A